MIGSPPASASAVRTALLGLRIGRRIELDQGELDLDMRGRVEILDLEHVDHALELREHLAQVPVVPADARSSCANDRARGSRRPSATRC